MGEESLWRFDSMASSRGNSSTQGHDDHHHHHQEKHISFGIPPPPSSSSPSMHGNFINKDTGAYDLGELDQALFMYLEGQGHPSVQEQSRQTLNIFPSQPMHVEPSIKVGMSLGSPVSSASKRTSEPSMELGNSGSDAPVVPASGKQVKPVLKKGGKLKGAQSSSEHEGPKTPDPKTLRRLAQNREAARKSRLRKKAYVQQLETSRIKLTQLEQELHRARAQGVFLGGGALVGDQALPSDAALFDMEYGRWLEEHHRLMCELRASVQEHLSENELRMYVESSLAHYDELFGLKGMAVRSDVFHLLSGAWKTPAERCFMWMGGFRPSELIKYIVMEEELVQYGSIGADELTVSRL